MRSDGREWKAALADRFFIRPLHRSDIENTADVVAEAFDSPKLGTEVAHQLDVYCSSGLDILPLEQQQDGLPREYYAVISTSGAEEQLVGVAGLYRLGLWTWEHLWWIGWFAVSPDFRDSGLGGKALTFLMRLARSRGAEVIKVETPAGGRAVGFYQRHGFRDEALLKHHYSADLDAEVLYRRLDDIDPTDPRQQGSTK